MPTKPRQRPTVFQVQDLEASLEASQRELAEARTQLAQAHDDLTQVAQQRHDLEVSLAGLDREAKALAACVAALDELAKPTGPAGYTNEPPRVWSRGNTALPDALQTPEGRILLHLAARYGVDLIPRPTVVPHDPGPVLMELPRDLADRLTAMEEAKHRWK